MTLLHATQPNALGHIVFGLQGLTSDPLGLYDTKIDPSVVWEGGD